MGSEPVRLLFVCLGNICRSPTAEAVMRRLVVRDGLASRFEVDSAGTGDWHVGEPPDPRAARAAARRGLRLVGPARVVTVEDFDTFDVIVSMDEVNLAALRRLAPAGSRARLRMLGDDDVPDPYFGGDDGFEEVLDVIESGCARLLDELLDERRQG